VERSASQVISPRRAPDRRRWASVVLRCCGLLVVPLVVWVALPAPPPPVAPTPRRLPQRAEEPGRSVAAAPRDAPARVEPAAARGAEATQVIVGGEVLDPSGAPLPHAVIRCTLGEREIEGASDEAGHFQLAGDAAGCVAVARMTHLGPSAEVVLQAGAGNKLRLTPPTGIAGNVVDESGAPVMSFWLAVDAFEPAGGARDGGAAQPRHIEINDADGAFEWTELSAGRYALGVSVPLGPLSRSQPIDVSAGTMTRGVHLVVHPGVTVAGKVTDAKTQEPIDGAQVFVRVGTLSTRIATTRQGAFTVEGAPAGSFELHVFCFGYVEKIVRDLRGPAGGGPLHVDVALRATKDDAAPPSGG
jgi:hypothetical protein